jgi:hypothetical protein
MSIQPFNMPLNASHLNLIDLYTVDIEKMNPLNATHALYQ